MEKEIKKFWSITLIILIIISIIVISSLFLSHIFLVYYGNIDGYIIENTKIYIPESTPKKYHSTPFSIDTFDYWIFKLNEYEASEIEKELENGNWNSIEQFHIYKLSELNYLKIIHKYSKLKSNCFLSIYDLKSGEIITNNDESIFLDSSNWVVFVYDKDEQYYYCIHESY